MANAKRHTSDGTPLKERELATLGREKPKRRISPTVLPLYLMTVLFVILPLCYIVAISFLRRGEFFGVTGEFTFDNYLKMLDTTYLQVFATTFYMAVLTTAITFLVSYPFAYFTARLPAKARGVVLILLMAPFWLNSLIRLTGWITLLKSDGPLNLMLMQLGVIDEPLKLLYNFGAILLGMVYALAPFMILGIYNSVEKMDWSLIEAARDLGAGRVRAFFTVTLPLSMPGVVAGCILTFVPSVGLFFVSDLLGGAKTMLLGNLIRNEMLTSRNWPFGAALALVMLAVTMIGIAVYRKVTRGGSIGGIRI